MKVPSDQSAFLEDFIGRINSLAISQDILVDGNRGSMTVAEMVIGQLRPFEAAGQGRIETEGPTVELTSSAAQHLGMAIYELVTNAARYGALSRQMGSVDVNWHVTADRFRIEWTERGGPSVTAPARLGYGNQVLTTVVERSLLGVASIEYPSEGLRWSLDCPLLAVSRGA